LQDKLREAFKDGKVRWRSHAQQRMLERGIYRRDVVTDGQIIEKYEGDRPYPSFLIYSFVRNRPLHVLVAYSEYNNIVYVITAYEPDEAHFMEDHVTRRREE